MAPRTVIPIQAADPQPAAPQRRRLLQLMAASAALATGACTRAPDERLHAYVHMPEAGLGGLPVYYASAYVRDGFAHGVLVGTREGRPVKIEGNPRHPAGRGGTDVFVQASVLELWDPDRSQTVWRRLRGGSATPATWDDFQAAWLARLPALKSGHGKGLHLLTGAVSSPTQQAQMAALMAAFPEAQRWCTPPLEDAAAIAGAQRAFGRPLRTLRRLDRARLVVAFGADPFSHGPEAATQAADWAQARRVDLAAGKAPAQTWAFETAPGLFGAQADRRIALPPSDIEQLLWRVAHQLAPDLAPPPSGTGAPLRAEAELVAALRATGADALLIPGPGMSPESHALVHALHRRLGAFGRTVDVVESPTQPESPAGDMAGLCAALRRGEVQSLLVLDANPVYETPGATDLANLISHVPFSAHLGLYRDETAVACGWHLPMSHVYEAWGDARAWDGSASVLQPAISPLYDTRSPVECLALLTQSAERDGHALVQKQWGLTEAAWRQALRDGVVPGSRSAPVAAPKPGAITPPARPQAEPADTLLQALFLPDPSTAGGRYANNGWLQELPRPFSKLTWDNAATIGPDTAARLGLKTGDIVRLTRSAAPPVDIAVWVEPRHAEGAVTLTLGYGRRNAGHVGDGVGVDVSALRPADSAVCQVSLQKTGRRQDFAVTQQRMDQQGRELARSVPLSAPRLPRPPEAPSLYPPRDDGGQHAWAMNIDLDTCIGCNACTVACQSENNIPVVGPEQVAAGREMHWIRVDRYDDPDSGSSTFQPVPCMHCETAPCEVVCPVGATVHDSEGLNVQVYNRCVGTRFCSNNCPYKVRRFNFLAHDDEAETLQHLRNPEVTVRRRGVMEKCTFCVQRLSQARLMSEKSGQPLADGDVRTACQSACPTQAIRFGDLMVKGSAVNLARQSERHYAMLEELGTRPRTTYLARVVNDRLKGGE